MVITVVPSETNFAGAALPAPEDIVTNGAFAADTDWTKGTGATITVGTLDYDGTQVAASQTTQTPATALKFTTVWYTIEITSVSAGAIRVIAGDDAGAWLSTVGVHRGVLTATSGTDIGVEADVDFTGSVDNLAIFQRLGDTGFGKGLGGSSRSGNGWTSFLTEATRPRDGSGEGVSWPTGAFDNVITGNDQHKNSDNPFRVTGDITGVGVLTGTADGDKLNAPGLNDPAIAQDWHLDYHFRLWVIPPVLQLANPQLNTAIGFRLWNTWTDPETIQSVLVSGSSVLTFNLVPFSTEIGDSEFYPGEMFIGPGEPSIEATVSINTENLSGELAVFAAVADTFNLIPDIPVRERWEFLTDIMVAYDGTEQRVQLRPRPRIEQSFTVEIIDLQQRLEQWQLLSKNIRVQSLVPFYQYSTKLTQSASIGATKIFFDPARTNMREGEFLVAVNPETEDLIIARVTTLDADGANLNSSIAFDVTPQWITAPAFNCIIGDGSGVTMNKVTGSLRVKADTFEEPALQRPGSTATLTTLAATGLPILERRPLIPASEDWEYRREVLDNETGKRDLNSRDLHGRVGGKRRFVIQRVQDPTDLDYWRLLFDTVRGSWGAFYLSTYFPDLTLVPGQTPFAEGFSGFDVNEGDYPALFFPYETWKQIAIEFPNGTTHYATVLNAVANPDGTATISISPAVPADPELVSPSRISYLTKVRAEDKIQLEHFADVSYISFKVMSTDEG